MEAGSTPCCPDGRAAGGSRTEARVEALAEAQRRTEARLESLAARVDVLAGALHELADTVAALNGDNLERKFREKVQQFVRPYRGARLFSLEDLVDALDSAVEQSRLAEEDADEVLRADAVVRARDEDGEVFLTVEVSSVVDRHDVERAARRARILGALGRRAKPAVAGVRMTQGAEQSLATAGAAWFQMGGH